MKKLLRKKTTILNFSILLCLILITSCADKDSDTVIKIDDRKISFEEFQSRLNSIPQTLKLPIHELKQNLTATLIAETVFSCEAQKEKLDTLKRVSLLAEEYKNEALYEEWMNKEVRAKINVSEKEILDAYPKFVEKRSVNFWTVKSLAESEKLRKGLLKGNKLDIQPQFKEIEYSVSLPEIENAVYNLKSGEISDPILVDSLYYIFKLVTKEPVAEFKKYSRNELLPEVEKRVRERKEKYSVDQKISSLMNDRSFSINKQAYNFLLQQLYPVIYNRNGLKYKNPESIQYELLVSEIRKENSFKQTLITFDDNSNWTVEDCWEMISVSPYPLNYENPNDLEKGLFDVLKRIILLNSVSQDALQREYNNTGYVKQQSAMWQTNILAQSYISKAREEIFIEDERLIQIYDSTKYDFMQPEKFKIIPLIVKDKKLSNKLYKRIIAGTDIVKITKQYSLNKLAVNSKEPGLYITRNMWGKIGEALVNMKPGDISKPIENKDGTFAIVKLLEIKRPAPFEFEKIKDKVYSLAVDKQLQNRLNNYLREVIANYKISIDQKLIDKIEYFGGNMGIKKTHFPIRSSVPMFPFFDHKAKWYRDIAGL
ncbi:MAG: peptidyl-prolyl cis-trans isomerase [Melioribacteraceae bacterium]|nr:peptidyl-prolyl cis-trans isomerase [Melioribacteraceae bacterium]